MTYEAEILIAVIVFIMGWIILDLWAKYIGYSNHN